MLNNKYDFFVVLSVKNANPNGDPLNENRPRINYDGIGEISDVCLKRKIRNRMQDLGADIFVQSDDNKVDEYSSLRSRATGIIPKEVFKDKGAMTKMACETWLDVRTFGQVFAFSGGKDVAKGVSVGIRGPVSLQPAFSVDSINITSIQITKSVNSEGEDNKKSSDTMGMKHRVDYGLYTFAGSINPQLAEKTGFSDKDVEILKECLLSLFDNDASSSRPEGSMEVAKLYWWKHNCKAGQYSSAKVHRTVSVKRKESIGEAKSLNDYDISVSDLPGLEVEIIEGR